MTQPQLPRIPQTVGIRFRRIMTFLFYSAAISAVAILLIDTYLPGFFETVTAPPRPEPELEEPAPPAPPPSLPMPRAKRRVPPPSRRRRPPKKLPEASPDPSGVDTVRLVRGQETREEPRPEPKRVTGEREKPRGLWARAKRALRRTEWINPRQGGWRFTPFRKPGGPGSAPSADEPLDQELAEPPPEFAYDDSGVVAQGDLVSGRVVPVSARTMKEALPPLNVAQQADNLFPELQKRTRTPEENRLKVEQQRSWERRRRRRLLMKKIGWGGIFTAGSFLLMMLLSGLIRAAWKITHPPLDPRAAKED